MASGADKQKELLHAVLLEADALEFDPKEVADQLKTHKIINQDQYRHLKERTLPSEGRNYLFETILPQKLQKPKNIHLTTRKH